jgi:hypothetical protein
MVALPETISETAVAMDRAREERDTPRDGYRVPASGLGNACERALWYSFRWVTPPRKIEGRILRLFEDGQFGETQMIGDLRAAGVQITDRDPDKPEKQIGFGFADGHGWGWLDGEALNLPEAPKTVHVLEIKTHKNTSFNSTKKHGVEKDKPDHYAQMMIGMHSRGRSRAVYVYKNKDTSEVHTQRIDYRLDHATALNLKAERVAYADRPPGKLHDDPEAKAAFQCRFMCEHLAVCHNRATARRNCRTCVHVTPERGGAWSCSKHGHELDKEAQQKGCALHLFIPDLVPGDQVDADLEAGWIEYRMPDGTIWRDQSGEARS